MVTKKTAGKKPKTSLKCDETLSTKKTISTRKKAEPQKTKKVNITRIIVKYDAGFANNLYIRGAGVNNLNWNKGIPLKNVKADEWICEIEHPFTLAEFKILLNDSKYEEGENRRLEAGSSVQLIPVFN